VKIPTIINDGPTKVMNNQDNNFYLINGRFFLEWPCQLNLFIIDMWYYKYTTKYREGFNF